MAISSSLGSTLIGNSGFTLFSGSLTAVVWRSRGHDFQLEDIFHPVCAGVSNAHSESSAVQSLATLDMEHIRSTRAGGSLLAFENLRSACWPVRKCRRVRPVRIARSAAIWLDSAGVRRLPPPQKISTSSGETLSGPQIGPSSQCECDSGRAGGAAAAAAAVAEDGSIGLVPSMAKTSSSGGAGTESGREAQSSSVLTAGMSPQSEGAVGEGDMVSSVEVEGGLKGAGKGAVEATLCSRSEPRVDQASSAWDSSSLIGGNVAEAAASVISAAAAAVAAWIGSTGTTESGLYCCHSLRGRSVGRAVPRCCCLTLTSRVDGKSTGMNSCLIENSESD